MNTSGNFYRALAVLCFGLPQQASAGVGDWPQLKHTSGLAVCGEALKIAVSAFQSARVHLDDRPAIPADVGSTLVFPVERQAGSDFIGDPDVFEAIPRGDKAHDTIYWQKEPANGFRLAISEEEIGWRGDTYALVAVPEGLSPATFIAQDADMQRHGLKPILEGVWRPPFLLRQNDTGEVWAIDVYPWTSFMGDWTVYTVGADGAKPRCTVSFHEDADTPLALLPPAVRRLATSLDGTVGSGNDEGTLHPTAQIRIVVEDVWGNIAMRPWAALKMEPYNDRRQVDAELKAWSKKARSFAALYRRINAEYPRAERALALYYGAEFGRTAEEALAMAEPTLDIA